jgi:hypothetical protein
MTTIANDRSAFKTLVVLAFEPIMTKYNLTKHEGGAGNDFLVTYTNSTVELTVVISYPELPIVTVTAMRPPPGRSFKYSFSKDRATSRLQAKYYVYIEARVIGQASELASVRRELLLAQCGAVDQALTWLQFGEGSLGPGWTPKRSPRPPKTFAPR